jgi:two-component system sensor histidine kinase/response regulator
MHFAHLPETARNVLSAERGAMTAVQDFDETVLANLQRLGGVQLAQRILALFLEHTPTRLEAVRVGLQEGDLESVERAAHSLKSTSGHLRIMTMQELAGNIERLAMAEQREAISGPLHDLEVVFARLAPILEKHRSELGA